MADVNVVVTAENAAAGPLEELSAQLTALTGQMAELNTQMGAMGDKMGTSGAKTATAWDNMAKSMKSTGAALSEVGGKVSTYLALPIAAAGLESIHLAAQFEQSMTRVSTLAKVPQKDIAGLSDQVLKLAGQVGFSPDSLAEAFYHTESQFAGMGLSSKQAIDMLKVAAEGAKIGGADLVDVTNALGAAVVAGIPGVKNYSEAMGALNATVGAGDMTMQNLAEALGTGVLAVIKGYGATIQDAAAALATFGDNNIRGAAAGTQLRMSIQALTVPTKAGQANLVGLGMTANQLSKDMQHGGLNEALIDLTKHLDKAGITGTQVGEWLTESFGKRAGVGVSVLMGQLDRFQGKYAEAVKGAKDLDSEWAQQQQTAKQKFDDFRSSLEALGVRLGNALLPAATQFVGWLQKMVEAFERLTPGQKKMIEFGALFILMVGPIMMAVGSVLGFVGAVMAIGLPVGIAIAAIVALGAIAAALITWWGPITGFFKKLWDDVKNIFKGGSDEIGLIVAVLQGHPADIKKAWDKLKVDMPSTLGGLKDAFVKVIPAIVIAAGPFGTIAIDILANWNKLADFFKNFGSTVTNALKSVNMKSILNGLPGGSTVIDMAHAAHLPGWASGGYTGSGGANEIAGIVHKGEYVIPQSGVNQSTGRPMGGNSTTVTIQNVNLHTAAAVREFFDSIDQDLTNTGKGLTPARGM